MKRNTSNAPSPPLRRWAFAVALVGLAAGCYQEPTRWDEAQARAEANGPAVAREAIAGGEFNRFFPETGADAEVIYTQEKRGFAEADLKRGGAVVATLAVFDTASNPEAAEKYRGASAKIDAYPMVDVGENGTGLLVGDRFQVQVRSKDANFTRADREDWLRKFDLANLAALANRP